MLTLLETSCPLCQGWCDERRWYGTTRAYIFIVFSLIYVSHSNHKIKCSAFTRCWIKWQSVTVALKQTGEQHYFATQLSDQRTINMLQLYQATPIIVAFGKLLHTCYIFSLRYIYSSNKMINFTPFPGTSPTRAWTIILLIDTLLFLITCWTVVFTTGHFFVVWICAVFVLNVC